MLINNLSAPEATEAIKPGEGASFGLYQHPKKGGSVQKIAQYAGGGVDEEKQEIQVQRQAAE